MPISSNAEWGQQLKQETKSFLSQTWSPALRFLLLFVCVRFRLAPRPPCAPILPLQPGFPLPPPTPEPHRVTEPPFLSPREPLSLSAQTHHLWAGGGWQAATQAHNGALRAAAGPGPSASSPRRGARPRRGSGSPAIRESLAEPPHLLWGPGKSLDLCSAPRPAEDGRMASLRPRNGQEAGKPRGPAPGRRGLVRWGLCPSLTRTHTDTHHTHTRHSLSHTHTHYSHILAHVTHTPHSLAARTHTILTPPHTHNHTHMRHSHTTHTHILAHITHTPHSHTYTPYLHHTTHTHNHTHIHTILTAPSHSQPCLPTLTTKLTSYSYTTLTHTHIFAFLAMYICTHKTHTPIHTHGQTHTHSQVYPDSQT